MGEGREERREGDRWRRKKEGGKYKRIMARQHSE